MSVNPQLRGWDHALPEDLRNDEALFRTIFTSDILAAYEENLILRPLIQHRTIQNGIRERFQRTWKMPAKRHERKAEMLAEEIEQTAVEIDIDKRPLYSAWEDDDVERLKAHFDVRQEASRGMGVALARTVDSHVARLIINAAREEKPTGDESSFPPGGGAIYDTNMAITMDSTQEQLNDAAGSLLKAIGRGFKQFDLTDVPIVNLNCAVSPLLWHALLEFGVPQAHSDVVAGMRPVFADTQIQGPTFGQLNVFPGRQTPLVYRGVRIWNSPSVPEGEDFTGVDEPKYQGDFTNTVGMLWNMDAAAYLELMGLILEEGRDGKRGLDWITARLHGGGGTLRREAAIELRKDVEDGIVD